MLFTQCRNAAKRFSVCKQIGLALLLTGLFLTIARPASAQSLYYSTAFGGNFTPNFGGELNDRGQAAGSGNNGTQALLWLPFPAYGLPAGISNLGTLPGGSYGSANSINALGQVVGEASVSNGSRAFLWLPAPAYGLPAGMNNLGVLSGGSLSLANGINAQGQVVGASYNYQGYTHAILWLPSAAYGLPVGLNDLGTLGGTTSSASAINAQGQIVGYSYNATGREHASLWLPSAAYGLPAGMNDLGTLPGAPANAVSYAVDINSLGQVVGSSMTATGDYHGFLWLPSAAYGLPAGMNDLGVVAGDTYSHANGINDKGQVVVSGATNGFMWQNGVQTPITGQPSAINASGQIAVRTALLTPIGGPQTDHGGNAPGSLVTVTLVSGNSAGVTQAALLAPGPAHAPGTNSGDIIAQYSSLKAVDAYSIRATFDLSSAAPGPRSIVVSYGNGTSITLPFPFTIDSAGAPQIAVSLIGGNAALIGGVQQQYLRIGRTGTYQLVLTNTGNVDAVGVPIWIVFPSLPSGAVFDYSGFGLQAPPALSGLTVNWNNYTAFPALGPQSMLPIFLARLPAGASQSLQIKITPAVNTPVNAPLPIQVWSNPFYHDLAANQAQAQANLKNLAKLAYGYASTGQTANDSAFNTAAGQVIGQMNGLTGGAYSGSTATGSLTSFAQMLDEVLLLTPQGKALSASTLQSATAIALAQSPGLTNFTQESFQGVAPLVVSSLDPNTLTGPVGFASGSKTFLRSETPMTFTLGFGNMSGAFSAQNVALTQSLDSSVVDLNRLTIQAVTVEGTTGNPNSPSYALTSAPLTQQSSPVAGRSLTSSVPVPQAGAAPVTAAVSAAVNLDTSVLTCSLSTNAPAGFLAGGASGTVSFSVPWKAGAASGATLQTQASIQFDSNVPTNTNTLTYVLDNAPPTSAVLPLSAQSALQFTVQWAGADNANGSGLKDYTIYVSDNGSAYTVWQTNTTATQATYTGIAGHTYSFVSQSRDNLNNTEVLRTSADATTTAARTVTGRIALEGVSNLAAVSPAAPLGMFHLAFRQPGKTAELYGYNVSLTTAPGSSFGTYTLYNVPAGPYDVTIKGGKSLRVLISGVSVTATNTLPDATLPAGDSNNDNSVDSSDFGTLIGVFNSDSSIPGSGYDATVDFNFDGFVDSSDFALLIGEFNNAGAL